MTTAVQVLKAAADIVGGEKELAQRLEIGQRLLALFMEGQRALPDRLLLRAVDIVLEDRRSHRLAGGQRHESAPDAGEP